jgi:8-oxo-dGTP pyrophosphatase MutT (NUDIX family)
MFRRRKADADTEVRSGVGVIIRDRRGRVLLERRSDCGWWGLVGGRIDPGESAAQAAVREAQEETGLKIKVKGLHGVYSAPANRLVTYPERVVQLVDIIVEAGVLGGALRASSESLELAYFPLGALPADIVPPAAEILLDLRRGRRRVLA